jgi:leucyl/phenylalanyl-tRNA--protein transferase
VHVGGLFAGESMFHDPELGRDASKVALVRLMVELAGLGVTLLDVQWLTEHLGTLGAYEVTRDEYMRRSRVVVALPTAPWTRTGPVTGADVVAEHRLLAD